MRQPGRSSGDAPTPFSSGDLFTTPPKTVHRILLLLMGLALQQDRAVLPTLIKGKYRPQERITWEFRVSTQHSADSGSSISRQKAKQANPKQIALQQKQRDNAYPQAKLPTFAGNFALLSLMARHHPSYSKRILLEEQHLISACIKRVDTPSYQDIWYNVH